ncbi:MAG: Unknown protein, partial [uncultured Thiotrichaceae bacterium]
SSDDAYGGKITRYRWEQVSGPDVALTDSDKAMATFTTPAAVRSDSQLVFQLNVTDDVGLSDSKQVVITVPGKGGGGGSFPVGLLGMLGILGLRWFKRKC